MSLANPWVLPMLGLGLVLVAFCIRSWRSRTFMREQVWCGLAGAMYALPYAAEMASTSLEAKLLWHRVAWIGIASLPAAAILLALRFVHRPLGRRGTLGVWAVAGVFVLLSSTNELHFWLETPATLASYGAFAMRKQEAAWAFWVFAVVGYAGVLGALFCFAGAWLTGSAVVKRQGRLLCLGTMVPIVGNGFYLSVGIPGIRELDPTPILYAVTCIVYLRSLQSGVLRLVPVARHAMFEEMDVPMFVLDRDDRVVDANPAARTLVGAAGAHDPTTTLARFAEGAVEVQRVLADGAVGELGNVPVGARTFAVRATSLSGGEGRLVLFRDETERIRTEAAQERALEAEANARRARDGFIARMSHELRTPLHGVIGSTEALLAALEPKSPLRGYAETSLLSARTLLELVDDVLDFERAGRGAYRTVREPFDLAALAREVTESQTAVARAKRLDLELTCDGGPTWVLGDRRRLRQILLNLLGNALKFTERGRVRVRVDTRPHEEGVAFRIDVEDEGPGIPEGELARVVEPFVQLHDGAARRHGGAGLGLAICRQISALLGLEMHLVNREHGGLCASIRGVLAESAEPPSTAAAEASRAEGATLLEEGETATSVRATGGAVPLEVFVVDDNPVGRDVSRWLLEQVGARPTVFATSAALLAEVAARAPDIVLCDLHMPDGGGVAVARTLRARGHDDLPIVAFTADARREVAAECLAAGMDDVLPKPCTVDELRTCLERHARAKLPGPPAEQEPPELRARFLRALPEACAELQSAASTGDDDELRRLAHELAGAAAFAGFSEIVSSCRAVLDHPEPARAAALIAVCQRAANNGSGPGQLRQKTTASSERTMRPLARG